MPDSGQPTTPQSFIQPGDECTPNGCHSARTTNPILISAADVNGIGVTSKACDIGQLPSIELDSAVGGRASEIPKRDSASPV